MFRKLVKAFRSKKNETETRVIKDVSDLLKGDIISFKERSELPPSLQGVDAEVTAIGCYEYSDENEKELTLKTTKGEVFHLTLVCDDGDRYLSLSKPVSSVDIQAIFDQQEFAVIFDQQQFATNLMLQGSIDEKFCGWLGDNYHQTSKAKTGFYHPNSAVPSGRGQQFISHYCESEQPGYGLQIEIWEDGDTDIFAICECSEDLIKDLWPASE